MRTIAISDNEFGKRYKWTPPKIIDRSEPQEGQQTLPGLEDMHHSIPAKGVKPGHPLYHEAGNPKVWGSLAAKGVHNPFLNHGLSGESDIPGGWSQHDDDWDDKTNHLATKVEKHLQKTVSAGHPCINLPDHALHSVLDEGRVKSQFETGTSRGSLNPEGRATTERANFGYQHPDAMRNEYEDQIEADSHYDEDAHDENERRDQEGSAKHPDHARPVYGYLAHDPFKNSTSTQYGEHTLVLKKPKVWHRTTTTMDDSLNDEDGMRASAVQDVKLHSADPMAFHNDWRASSGTHDSELHARLNYHLGHSLDDKDSYTEAQYHGGVSTNDVHYAILRGHGHKNDNHQAIKAHLDKAKIPWVHIGAGDWGGSGAGTEVRDHSREAMLHRAVQYQVTLVAALEGNMTAPKIVAHRGEGIYLVDLGDHQGQIADTRTGTLYPPKHLDAIVARGYWQNCDDVDAADVLSLVKPV